MKAESMGVVGAEFVSTKKIKLSLMCVCGDDGEKCGRVTTITDR